MAKMRRKKAAGSRSRRLIGGTAGASALAVFFGGCADPPAPNATPAVAAVSRAAEDAADEASAAADAVVDAAVARLVDEAADKRAALDFATLPPWSDRAGPDPIAVLSDEGRTLALLRRGRLLSVDADAALVAETPTLPGASALLRVGAELVVASEATGELQRLDARRLVASQRHEVAGVHAIRGVAFGAAEARLYLADPHRHRILRVAWPPTSEGALSPESVDETCAGALSVRRVGDWLAYTCMLGHRIVVRKVGADGTLGASAIVEHDGPIWSFDAALTAAGGLTILAGGVEDHPLDRRDGGFGYIDSFAFVIDVAAGDAGAPPVATRRHALNVSEHGVVTPKAVRWSEAPFRAIVTGYGGATALEVTWPAADASSPVVVPRPLPPGTTDFIGTLDAGMFANPLLDALVVTSPGGAPRIVAVGGEQDTRTPSERLGEALVFTTAMAPHGTSEGHRSRFTCETCHFEGRTDGRVHWTGRGDVHATTKTLRGLFNNRPHFSRALDKTTAKMVHSEFRVANTGTDFDPWFSLTREDAPWLDALGAPADPLEPVVLRRAVVDFLAIFTPDANPAVRGLTALSPSAAEGMQLFSDACASCHAPRLIADDAGSVIDRERWPAHILSPTGGIVWGEPARHQTGVTPYVHPDGPRVPSLRRLWVKRPLLTNGAAADVDAVLADVRLDTAAVHGGGTIGRTLTDSERRALGDFLDLL
jgi:hypothetical protein